METNKPLKILVILIGAAHRADWEMVDALNTSLLAAGCETIYFADEPLFPFSRGDKKINRLGSRGSTDEAVVEEIEWHARAERVDYIMALSEWATRWLPALNTRLGLPGIRTERELALLNKLCLHEVAQRHQMGSPHTRLLLNANDVTAAATEFRGPVIVKPSESSARLRIRGFDYVIYPDFQALIAHLSAKNRWQLFFQDNENPQLLGAHLVQEYVQMKNFLLVNFVVIQGKLKILQMGRHLYAQPKMVYPEAVEGHLPLAKEMCDRIEHSLLALQKDFAFNNTFGSIQYALGYDGQLNPIDFHLRLLDSLLILLLHYRPEVIIQSLLGFLGRPYHLDTSPLLALKKIIPIRIEPGSEVHFPSETKPGLRVCNLDTTARHWKIKGRKEEKMIFFYLTVHSATSMVDCCETAEAFAGKVQIVPPARENNYVGH